MPSRPTGASGSSALRRLLAAAATAAGIAAGCAGEGTTAPEPPGRVALAGAGDPAIEILPLPDNGAFVSTPPGNEIEVEVEVSNAAVGASGYHVRYYRDGAVVAEVDHAGPFTFTDVPIGRRQLAARLVTAAGATLPNPESLDKVYAKVLGPCPGGVSQCDDGLSCSNQACTTGTCNYGPVQACCDHDLECAYGWSCVAKKCQECLTVGQCDDGEACTTDACTASGSCTHTLVPGCCSFDGQGCDDGDACTSGEACGGGVCGGGAAKACGDGNPCTTDGCEGGACTHIAAGGDCDDGNACTVEDACQDGVCLGTAANCDGTGASVTIVSPAPNETFTTGGAPVDVPMTVSLESVVLAPDLFHLRFFLDGVVAGEIDQLSLFTFAGVPQGRHQLAARIVLPDGSGLPGEETLATVYVRVSGPCSVSNPSVCEDGLACSNHSCSGGQCKYGPVAGCCDHDLECPYTWVCVDHACVECFEDAGCEDFDPCTDDVCGAGQTCSNPEIPGCCQSADECDDADACTLDTCDANACAHEDVSADCDEGNPCKDYGCSPLSGCTQANNSIACDDGDACTVGDACLGGACKGGGGKLPCDDGNGCTDDACDPATGCSHVPNEAACDDGDACTAGDTCSAGACEGGALLSCADATPCTADSCDPDTGCVHVPAPGACDDGNACTTTDECQVGTCKGSGSLACADDNACTNDSCDPKKGCVFAFNSAPCDDADPCTLADACAGGSCKPGKADPCSDGEPCTDDSCLGGTGCQHSPNTVKCQDGSACTTGDVCSGGSCQGGPAPDCDDGEPCTDDACASATGCTHAPNAAACDDGNECTTGDHCAGGACASTPLVDCDDEDPCTDDLCDLETGCTHVLNAKPCDDGSACTDGDQCKAGACQPGKPVDCDDGNPCTADSCSPATGCAASPAEGACDDGDPCTLGDACDGGACVSGPAADCDDGNPCTLDGCDAGGACQNAPSTAPCDDGDLCTQGDSCDGGACKPGLTVLCNDTDLCTDDFCDPGVGCVHTPNAASCEDGDGCTKGDACQGGLCLAGDPVDCDDGDPCTLDTCKSAFGCFHAKDLEACPAPDPDPDAGAADPDPDAGAADPDAGAVETESDAAAEIEPDAAAESEPDAAADSDSGAKETGDGDAGGPEAPEDAPAPEPDPADAGGEPEGDAAAGETAEEDAPVPPQDGAATLDSTGDPGPAAGGGSDADGAEGETAPPKPAGCDCRAGASSPLDGALPAAVVFGLLAFAVNRRRARS